MTALHHFQEHTVGPAIGMRQKHFMLDVPVWEPSSKSESAGHKCLAADLSLVLAPVALQGGYANFLVHRHIAADMRDSRNFYWR